MNHSIFVVMVLFFRLVQKCGIHLFGFDSFFDLGNYFFEDQGIGAVLGNYFGC